MIRLRIPLVRGAVLLLDMEDDGAAQLLQQRTERGADLRPLLEEIAAIMRKGLGERFAQGGPGWQPLKPSTVAAKRAAGVPPRTAKGNIPRRLQQNGAYGPANILIRTGALRDSYRQKGAKGHVERIDTQAGTVEVGSSLSYASVHQKGSSAYIIRARVAKALAFTGSNGETILRKAVNHPGLPARPVKLTMEDQQAIRQVVQAWLAGQTLPRAA